MTRDHALRRTAERAAIIRAGMEASTYEKMRLFEMGMGSDLRTEDARKLLQAMQVLRRIAEGECTNPQREALDIVLPLWSNTP